jgi:hypothetical protein
MRLAHPGHGEERKKERKICQTTWCMVEGAKLPDAWLRVPNYLTDAWLRVPNYLIDACLKLPT